MRRTLIVPLLLLAACSAPPSAVKDERPAAEKMHVHLATDGVRLGGYTMILKWDPTVAVIERITPCNASKFPGAPEYSSANLQRGWIKVWGLTTDKHEVPPEYDLFTVHWRPLRADRMKADLEIQALYDMSKRPKPIQGRITSGGGDVDFGKAPGQ